MSYHPFERICSLWLERVNHHFVIENLPVRYGRRKRVKNSPATATTDFDIISYDLKNPKTINLCECKANINQTADTKSRTRLLRQLKDQKKHSTKLPFAKKVKRTKQWVFGIRIAKRIKETLPKNAEVIEGEQFEHRVLDELIMLVARDPKIDPKDDVLFIVRLFWHFGLFKDDYYQKMTQKILEKMPSLSANALKGELGLISYKTDYCKQLLKKARRDGR